jgi:transcription factor IIIB subunit 2
MGRHLEGNSRDTTLFNARKTISQLASTLKLPPLYIDRAYRLYQLALQRNFIFGRRQTHVSAACLYIICRQEKSPHLLIDFSDALQINVYLLGKAFLHFLKVLNLNLPVVDPSLYIHRFASKLEFGDKMNSVIISSLRIVTRLKKDWIAMGRRPDGVCAAALLISARAHGFNVSQENVAQLFKIAEDTLRKRLHEFKSTPSGEVY